MAQQPRILVVEGNTAADCAKVEALCGTTSSGRYRSALLNARPDARIDVILAAEPDAALPRGVGLSDFHGVVVGGSSLRADDAPTDRRVSDQVDLVRQALTAGLPVLGSCWGLQVAAMAAGGRVAANPLGREIGIARKLALTPAGRGHPLFDGKAAVFDSFCVHYDEVTHLPPGAVVLAANAHSAIQAACLDFGEGGRPGSFWGVQYHPEFDFDYMACVFERAREDLKTEGLCADNAAVATLAARYRSLHQNPRQPDLAWRLGLDSDVLDTEIREREIANWLRHAVMPRLGNRPGSRPGH